MLTNSGERPEKLVSLDALGVELVLLLVVAQQYLAFGAELLRLYHQHGHLLHCFERLKS